MLTESQRLYTQLKELLKEADLFDFLCDHTFGTIDTCQSGSLKFSQVAPLIENVLAAKSQKPCEAAEVHAVWQQAVDPLTHEMLKPEFRAFVRVLFEELVALYDQYGGCFEEKKMEPPGMASEENKENYDAVCEDEGYVDEPPPLASPEFDDNRSVLTDCTDLSMLAKECCRLSPAKFKKKSTTESNRHRMPPPNSTRLTRGTQSSMNKLPGASVPVTPVNKVPSPPKSQIKENESTPSRPKTASTRPSTASSRPSSAKASSMTVTQGSMRSTINNTTESHGGPPPRTQVGGASSSTTPTPHTRTSTNNTTNSTAPTPKTRPKSAVPKNDPKKSFRATAKATVVYAAPPTPSMDGAMVVGNSMDRGTKSNNEPALDVSDLAPNADPQCLSMALNASLSDTIPPQRTNTLEVGTGPASSSNATIAPPVQRNSILEAVLREEMVEEASKSIVVKESETPRKPKAPPPAANKLNWSLKFSENDFHAGIHSILTSEEAALRFAQEWTTGPDFVDSDFGPSLHDPYGMVALGFECNATWKSVDRNAAPVMPITPGSLADTWFLSALAMVMNSQFLEDLWPRAFRPFAAKGLYCFCFWKHFNKPVYVMVDGLLPYGIPPMTGNMDMTTTLSERPLCAQNEWIGLVEKAFAKLHGSYTQLWSGWIDEGIEDLIGYPCEYFPINSKKLPYFSILGYARLDKNDDKVRNGNMRFVHVEGRTLGRDGLINTGILRNHLYIVKGMENNQVHLINPWSDGGWMGESKINFTMNREACGHVFTHVFALKSLKGMKRERYEYVWTPASSGGTPIPARQPVPATPESWLRNPRFRLEVEEEQEVIICLAQNDPRLHGDRFPFHNALEEIFILCMHDHGGQLVFEKKNIVRPSGMSNLSHRRQVQLRMRLESGNYLLIPSTWNVGVQKTFSVTMYAAKNARLFRPGE